MTAETPRAVPKLSTVAAISSSGAITARYDKLHVFDVDLPNGETYRESASVRPGEAAVVADSPWGGLGLTICYDLRFPHLHRALAKAGAQLIAVPAAYAMAFFPTERTRGTLLWMLSTKMMPAVAVLVPIYLIFLRTGLMDTRIGLTVLLMLINLPIVVWMLYTYFREIPGEILEAARMDGASLRDEILYVLTPMAIPGIASTLLLNIILAWNEAFWTIQLTTTNAAPLSAFIASFSSPEGLFWAKLSAASTLAIAPILVFGWMSQRQLVRGLTFGAVK